AIQPFLNSDGLNLIDPVIAPAGNNPAVEIAFVSSSCSKRRASLLLTGQLLESVVSDQLGDCLRSTFCKRGLLVCVDAQCMSCFEGCCLSGETLDRADDGLSLFATSIGSDLSPPKYPDI